jgi:hypothetical protein
MEKLNPMTRRHAGWSRSAAVWLVVLTATLWLTGIAMHLLVRDGVLDMPPWQENLQRVSTVVHGVAVWLWCVMAGRWVWPHVLLVWRRRHDGLTWVLGAVTLFTLLALALAGLGLLYGLAAWHEALAALHWWLGLAWPALCLAHAWKRVFKRRSP